MKAGSLQVRGRTQPGRWVVGEERGRRFVYFTCQSRHINRISYRRVNPRGRTHTCCECSGRTKRGEWCFQLNRPITFKDWRRVLGLGPLPKPKRWSPYR